MHVIANIKSLNLRTIFVLTVFFHMTNFSLQEMLYDQSKCRTQSHMKWSSQMNTPTSEIWLHMKERLWLWVSKFWDCRNVEGFMFFLQQGQMSGIRLEITFKDGPWKSWVICLCCCHFWLAKRTSIGRLGTRGDLDLYGICGFTQITSSCSQYS